MTTATTTEPRAATPATEVDPDKLNAFIARFLGDLGGAFHAGMAVIGEELGLYRALAVGPLRPKQQADKTHTDERYVREWLSSQAAGGYVTYDERSHTFSPTPEQAITMATEDSHLAKQAGSGAKRARAGAVTLIQRYGSALNLNLHFHMVFLDVEIVDYH